MKIRFFYICAVLFGLAGACLFYGFFIEPKRLILRQIDMPSQNYQGPPLRIAFISDIHIGGRHVSAQRTAEIMARVYETEADIILFGGDFISGHEPIERRSEAFNATIKDGVARLSSPETQARSFAVLGNHDVWYDAGTVAELLSKQMIILSNQATHFGNICLVGLEDEDTQSPNGKAFADCKAGADIIALMHSPDSFSWVPSNASLALAGHTHGGQINLPFIGRAVTSTKAGRKYAYGKVEIPRGVPAFVTAGIGTSILSARFRSPPEIVLITLRPQP